MAKRKAGTIAVNLWVKESSATVDCPVDVTVERCDSTGRVRFTIVAKTAALGA